jgi:glycosyltransferase involved in cell wall biosynthesis
MHIMFFSHYYPPEVNAPASRTSEHCELWAKAGHSVTVITCVPNHPTGIVYGGYRNRLFQSEIKSGVRIVRVWTFLAANEGFTKRTANYLSFMFTALAGVVRLPKPDIIISTTPQFFCGLTGLLAKILRPVPWVLEVRDLWPESILAVGAMQKGWIIRALEALERLAYRCADRIVVVTDSFVSHIAERCRNPVKIQVIKNGVDCERFHSGEDPSLMKERFGFRGRVVASYVGTHGLAHGLDTVLDAASLLRDDERIGFLMVGDGADRGKLQERAAAMKLENVRFVGQLPRSDMPAIWAATDISLILLRQNDTFKKVLPSKMFEAMAMSCPILLGVDGEARTLLETANAGIAVEPENANELAAAISRLVAYPELRRRFGQNGKKHVSEYYDRAKLAVRYLAILEEIVATRPNQSH